MNKLLKKLMNRNKIIVLGITSIFLLIIATLGFAYGYYSSFVKKIDQSKKITVTSGTSQITYIPSLIENDTIETIKPGFTSVDYFAAQNTGDTSAMYFIYLENVINTFVNYEDVSYSLYRMAGTNKINFDYIDIDTLDYSTWEQLVNNETYPIKDGLLKEKKETINKKNEYYIYALVINYKYRLDKDQSIDADHIFGGQIKLIPTDSIDTDNVYEKGTLAHEIINNSLLNLNGTKYTTKPIVSMEENSEMDTLLSVAEDDYGITYYYRGNVLDNYLDFNNMCWRIVRIEGDGSIKINLYDSTSTCSESLKDKNLPILKDNSIIESTYIENIKNELTTWYIKNNFNLLETEIKLDKWCLGNKDNKYSSKDNTLIENLDIYIETNKDLENNYTYNYSPKKRIIENNVTLKCEEKDYYESYIGMLNADEIVFNHNNGGINIKDYDIATLSMSAYNSKDNSNYVYTYELKEISELRPLVINPVITLKSGIKYKSGNGTISNAYKLH